jgi:DNA-binding NarL/FixJ family response regulator
METLTNREREVVALVAHGMSNDEIADAMTLSPSTAKVPSGRLSSAWGLIPAAWGARGTRVT